jgi:arginase
MQIAVIAVPYDCGRRSEGVGLGPAKLLEAGLANQLREAGHTVREASVEMPLKTAAHELARVTAVQRELAALVRQAVDAGELPIVLAGNCSTVVGTIAARQEDTAIIWFDAHPDFHTADTTTSGMVDGMALSLATGRALNNLTASVPGFRPVDEHRVILVGTRDLDPPEAAALAASPVRRVAVDAAPSGVAAAIRDLGGSHVSVYIHLDLDVLEPSVARANRYAVPGGLLPAALVATLDAIAKSARVYALAVTGYEPDWDTEGTVRIAALNAVKAVVPRPDAAE